MHKEKNLTKNSICSEIENYFDKKILELSKKGILKEKIILDPGFGFGKTTFENIEIISKFDYKKFKNLCLVGISRKGFLKKLTRETNLDQTSITTGIISLLNGAKILRVHNVPMTVAMVEEVFG
jgi:dihydropteroate synthase